MIRPTKKELERLGADYPAGTRVRLIRMDDPQSPPPGTCGTVVCVDDIGSLIMHWDNGCGLNLVPEADVFEKL